MLRFVLLSIGLLVSAISYCQRITFVSQDSIALPEVRCVGFTAQNDSIFYAVSRSNGIVNIPKGEVSRIVASHEGFRDKIIFMDKLVGDANTVIMLPPVALQEVVAVHVKHGGIFITSGIIDMKEQAVMDAFAKNPEFEVIDVLHQGEWVSIVTRRK